MSGRARRSLASNHMSGSAPAHAALLLKQLISMLAAYVPCRYRCYPGALCPSPRHPRRSSRQPVACTGTPAKMVERHCARKMNASHASERGDVNATAPPERIDIEVLNLNPVVKKAIILLLYHNLVKVLKDALAHLGPYQTLMGVWCIDPGGENTVVCPPPYKFKNFPYK